MPFRIAKSFTIESGHLLTKHPGACRFPHGHSRTVEIVLSANTLDAADMVCDFKAVKRATEDVVTRFDHAFALNTADPRYAEFREAYGERVVPFQQTDPTSEALAREIYFAVRSRLLAPSGGTGEFPIGSGVRLERVRITETATTWAEYWE
jgi:6-pyruvoyltetrahydropterin/6-carboxytetrahydropterin synthase